MLSILPLQRGNSELCQNAMPYDGPSLRSMRLGTLRARLPVCLCLPRVLSPLPSPPSSLPLYLALSPALSRLSLLPPSPPPFLSLSVSLTVIATFIFKVSWARYETGMDLASLPGFSYLSYQERTTNRLGFQWMEMNVDYYLYFIIVVVVGSKERVTIYC